MMSGLMGGVGQSDSGKPQNNPNLTSLTIVVLQDRLKSIQHRRHIFTILR